MGGTEEEKPKHNNERKEGEKQKHDDKEKVKDKKKKKDKEKGEDGQQHPEDKEKKTGKEKKKKNPEDKNDPLKLKLKLEKIDTKIRDLATKREEILKLIVEAEKTGAKSPTSNKEDHPTIKQD